MTAPKIISGGQTGADRAALDWALANDLPCGGWCPRGRLAEDGVIPARYPLAETSSAHYLERTEWNVRDSDATVILTLAPELSHGSLATVVKAAKYHKPTLHLPRELLDGDALRAGRFLREFAARHGVQTLNVAGTRASKEPEVGVWVIVVLSVAFGGR